MVKRDGRNLGCLIGIIFTASVMFTGVIGGISLLSNRNTIIDLEESIKQQYEANKSSYDRMVKTARESANIADMYAKDFNKVYKELIEDRNKDENLLFKVVKEHNPTLDSSLYATIQRDLSANRITFDNNQAKVLDRIREYNAFIKKKFITSAILNKQEINSEKYIVTSTETQDAFESGTADEIKFRGN